MKLPPKKTFNIDRLSFRFTRLIGSPMSLLLHTGFFIGTFSLYLFGVPFDTILLVLTTLVSLEAIYLAIFIQMSVNRQSRHISEVRKDIDEIQEDVAEITEDIDELQEDVEEISEDMEEDDKTEETDRSRLERIEKTLTSLLEDITKLREKEAAPQGESVDKNV